VALSFRHASLCFVLIIPNEMKQEASK
jgi:hypothetical protein